jgi:hypothetical protein
MQSNADGLLVGLYTSILLNKSTRLLLKQKGWMYLAEKYPVEVFKIVVLLFATKSCRKPLSDSHPFLFVLRAALEAKDPFIFASMPAILKQIPLNADRLRQMSQIGVLREFAEQSMIMQGDDFLAVSEILSKTAAFQEASLFTICILNRMSDEKLLSASLNVLIRLAAHPECAQIMTTSDLVAYLGELAQSPRFADNAKKLTAKLTGGV